MLGKSKDKEQWFCLQVAKTTNIAKEIASDITCMQEINSTGTEKNYVNQFGKFRFSHAKNDFVRDIEYSEIRRKYKDLIFVCVCLEDNNKMKSQVEKYFAWKTQALYWRNGRPYKNEKAISVNYLKEVRNNVCLGDAKIKKDIDNFLLKYEKIGIIFGES